MNNDLKPLGEKMEAALLNKEELLLSLHHRMEFGGEKFRIVGVIEVWLVSKLTSSRELKVVTTDDTMVETLNKALKGPHKWYESERVVIVTNGVRSFRLGETVDVWEPTFDSVEARALMIKGLSPEEKIVLGIPE